MSAFPNPEIQEVRGRNWSIGSHLLGHYDSNPSRRGNELAVSSQQTSYSPSSAVIEIHDGTTQRTPYENFGSPGNISNSPSLRATSSHTGDLATQEDQRPLLRASTTIYDRIITDWWWWELLSLLVSFFCVSAIVGLLLFYHDKKQPDYVIKGITINAMIAILAAVGKAAMILPVSEAIGQLKWIWFRREANLWDFHVFDGASRGPWGSIMLLVTSKCRSLVSVGAVVTILALAFEPFFQQIVVYPERSVPSGTSLVWAASNYVAPEFTVTDSGMRLVDDLSLTLATDTAFLSKDPAPVAAPSNCPTGNCTWPLYSSLGVCHQCRDVSTHLQHHSCENRTSFIRPSTGGKASNACGYVLNGTFLIGTSGDRETKVTSLTTWISNSNMRLPVKSTYWNSTAFPNASMPILDFYIAYMPGGPAGVLSNSTPILLECLLNWCVRTLESSHNKGSLHDKVVETKIIQPDGLSPPTNGSYDHPDISIIAGDNRTFVIENKSTSMMRNKTKASLINFVDQDMRYQFTESPGLWKFHQNSPYDISPYLDNATRTISDSLRSRESGTTAIKGTAWVREQYVAVRWAWLSLPIVLLLATSALVFATIIKSRKNDAIAWKSSALATLLHGLTEEAREQFHPSLCPSEIEAISQRIQVKLAFDNGKMRLGLV